MLDILSSKSPMNVKADIKLTFESRKQKNDSANETIMHSDHGENLTAKLAHSPLLTPSSVVSMLLPNQLAYNADNGTNNLMRMFPTYPFHKERLGRVSTSHKKTRCSTLKETKSCLVYLIRHGEASHNVLEKVAKRRAKEQAESLHLSKEETERRMEQARVAVLVDETLRDAKLSDQGRIDAQHTRAKLEELSQRLPSPSKVLVSPLTRTLETADLVFPDHDDIHVREELQERLTGKPCDCRRPSAILSIQPSFRRFQMEELRRNSFMKLKEDLEEDELSSDDSSQEESYAEHSCGVSRSTPKWNSDCRSDRPRLLNRSQSDLEEDRGSLRVRTRKLLGLLDQSSIAVVGHKGYFREFERGTLGFPDAKEMGNGEIRVYRICLDNDESIQSAERVV